MIINVQNEERKADVACEIPDFGFVLLNLPPPLDFLLVMDFESLKSERW